MTSLDDSEYGTSDFSLRPAVQLWNAARLTAIGLAQKGKQMQEAKQPYASR